ncbi:LPS-assembly protein LptD [bacterium endosymbiont of Escarpia laminata]|nr:MAG: LPS-assembly protein LptD [bacterium endosymbiont of Escarpia laminata]
MNRLSLRHPRIWPVPLLLIAASTLAADNDGGNLRIDRGLNWEYCDPASAHESTPLPLEAGQPGSTQVEADAAELDQRNNRTHFFGRVQVRQDDHYLEADHVHYQRDTRLIELDGNIYLEKPGLRVSGNEGQMDLDNNNGWLTETEFRLPERNARGSASRVDIASKTLSHYDDVSYTTCRPGASDWNIEAETLDINMDEGWGVARNAKLRFGGVPVFYTPYFSFPVDDRRKSGFLLPAIGSSSRGGGEFSIPYYLNLAPDYDATITPRLMSKRGLMLGGEFRFLSENQKGIFTGEILPNDGDADNDRPSTRGAFNIRHNSWLAPGLTTTIDAGYVSDKEYLTDFGKGLAITSSRHIEQRGDINYTIGDWSLLGRLQDFQTVDKDIARIDYPYSRLPQLLASYEHSLDGMGLDLSLETEYVYFDHVEQVRGHRVAISPYLSLPLRRSWGHLTPRVGLNYANYQLSHTDAGDNSAPSRMVPTLSLDSGLILERDSNWFGSAATHTLEPRLHYLYAPYEDQSDTPNFDSSELDFTFSSLFRDNRFSGRDRIGDANQITLALTSRLLESDSGRERFRASLGQILYFEDRKVQLNGTDVTATSTSSVVAELSSRLNTNWSSSATLRWDPHLEGGRMDKGKFALRYNTSAGQLLNFDYNYTRESIEDINVSAYWPIGHKYTLLGVWKHSMLFERDMNQILGMEYSGHCCWKLRALLQRYVTDADAEADTSFMIQLELTGLGALGDNIQDTLEESIYGYQSGN